MAWAQDSILHMQNLLAERQAEITWLEIKIYTVGFKYGHFRSFLTLEEAENCRKTCNTSCTAVPRISTAIKNCATGAIFKIGDPLDWGQTPQEFQQEHDRLRRQNS